MRGPLLGLAIPTPAVAVNMVYRVPAAIVSARLLAITATLTTSSESDAPGLVIANAQGDVRLRSSSPQLTTEAVTHCCWAEFGHAWKAGADGSGVNVFHMPLPLEFLISGGEVVTLEGQVALSTWTAGFLWLELERVPQRARR